MLRNEGVQKDNERPKTIGRQGLVYNSKSSDRTPIIVYTKTDVFKYKYMTAVWDYITSNLKTMNNHSM